jgi:hypothetical protein
MHKSCCCSPPPETIRRSSFVQLLGATRGSTSSGLISFSDETGNFVAHNQQTNKQSLSSSHDPSPPCKYTHNRRPQQQQQQTIRVSWFQGFFWIFLWMGCCHVNYGSSSARNFVCYVIQNSTVVASNGQIFWDVCDCRLFFLVARTTRRGRRRCMYLYLYYTYFSPSTARRRRISTLYVFPLNNKTTGVSIDVYGYNILRLFIYFKNGN